MARLADYRLGKAKEYIKTSNAKPERPRIQEQIGLEKNLVDLQRELTADDKKIDEETYGNLSEKWKGNGGGTSGDAFVGGLMAGIKKGSYADDKDRTKKVMDFTEKMKNIVAEQNVQLFKQEKLANSRNYVTPRIMAYLDTYKTMSPSDRKVYLQNTLEEYNQSAGTNYKLIDTVGSEPWKIMVSNDGDIEPLDLMDFIKTPEEKKLDYYYKSAENQQYEKELANDDNLDRQVKQSKIYSNQEIVRQKSEKYLKKEENSPQKIQEKKQQMIESGEIPEGSLLFDELDKQERQVHMKYMMEERDKAKHAEAGLEALDSMEQIFKDHPKISTSLAKWANSKNKTPFENLINDAVDQDTRDALLELEKHSATLALGTLQQFKGQRPTDVMKKLVTSTTPGSNFTPGAFAPVKDKLAKGFNSQLEESEKYSQGLSKRYVPPYRKIGASPKKIQGSVDVGALQQRKEELLRKKEELLQRAQQ